MTQSAMKSPIFCSRCGESLQPDARFCSRCAEPAPVPPPYQQSYQPAPLSNTPEKNVGFLLGLGIVFMPYVFSWFTLGKGYSTKAKLLSLSWMVIVVLIVWGPRNRTANISTVNSLSSSIPSKAETSPKETAMSTVKLDFKWNTAGFGNIMEADFTIQNPTNNAIKDIEITCTHYANSGTKIDSNRRIVYEIIPANNQKAFKKFNMGFIHSQARSSSCQITDLEIVQ